MGRALDELRDFPDEAKQRAGHHIDLVQVGETPPGSKPMPEVGRGCREICVEANDGWFRVFYVAKFGDAVWVLHCFQKKSNKTPQGAIETGSSRYKDAVAEFEASEKPKGR